MKYFSLLKVLVPLLFVTSVACDPHGSSHGDDLGMLETVPRLHELDSMDAPVRDEYLQVRGELDALLKDPAASSAEEFAQKFGRLGMWHHAYVHEMLALAAYRNAAYLAPREPRWPYLEARIHHRRGDYQTAEELYRHVLELLPEHLPSLLLLSELALADHRLEQAEENLADALELHPKSLRGRALRGKLALAQGDAQLAADLLQQVLGEMPEITVLHQPLGLAYRTLGDLEKAREHLDRNTAGSALQTVEVPLGDPWMQEVMVLLQSARVQMQRGRRALRNQDLQEAEDAYLSALEIAPGRSEALFNLAIVYERQGRLEETEKIFRRFLVQQPDSARATLLLAQVLLKQGRQDEAERFGYQALALDPDSAEAHGLMIQILRRGEFKENIERHARRLIELKPEQVKNHHLLALHLSRRELWPQSLEALENGIAIFPAADGIRLRQLKIRILSCVPAVRNPQSALTEAEQIRRLVPKVKAFDRIETLAMAYAAAGQTDRAVAWQESAWEAVRAAGLEYRAKWVGERLAEYRNGKSCEVLWKNGESALRIQVVPPEEAP